MAATNKTRCRICHTHNSRIQTLICNGCSSHSHRKCLKITPTEYWIVRHTWLCQDCNTSSLCPDCGMDPVFIDGPCMLCLFPPPEIHEVYSSVESFIIEDMSIQVKWIEYPNLKKGIRQGFLNVNSLRSKFDDLINLISTLKLHVICLAETKLNSPGTVIPNEFITIPNFNLVRLDRENKEGQW